LFFLYIETCMAIHTSIDRPSIAQFIKGESKMPKFRPIPQMLLIGTVLALLVASCAAPPATPVTIEKTVEVPVEVEKTVVVVETQIVEVMTTPEPAPSKEPLPEILLWAKTGPEGDALEKAAVVYTRETGNPVKVLIVGRAGFRQKYNTALAAGSTEVDGILDIARVVPSLAAAGLLAPLDEYIKNDPEYNLDDIPAPVQREMMFDGKWYMAPTDLSQETLVYRKDLIPEPPKTWEELRENAKKFTRSINPDSPTEYGYAYAGMPGNLVGTVLGIQHAYGGQIVDENMCVQLDKPEFIEAFSFLMDMKNVDKVTPPDLSAWDYAELLTALQEGVVAQASFFNAGMPVLTNCEQSPKVCNDQIAYVPQPAGPKGSFTRINPLGIMVNAASPRIDAVWAFLSWLTGPDGALIYTQFGGNSPRTSVLTNPEIVAKRPWLPAMAEASKNGVGNLRLAKAAEINDIFNKWADQALAGSISPEEALKKAAEELRALLDEANNPACKP
jgi:ABC-type glycerol-3-phosphate transport system substrate-binding protein